MGRVEEIKAGSQTTRASTRPTTHFKSNALVKEALNDSDDVEVLGYNEYIANA